MAYTKKTVTKTEDNTVNPDTKSTAKPKKTFTDSDFILCRSVWFGGLNVTCQSGNAYEFKDYGTTCEINYRDLITLIRKGSEHIFLPRFVIEDDDLLEEFPSIKNVYDNMYTAEDLLGILDLPNSKMRTEIEKLPVGAKDVLGQMIAGEIANGHLDSISKVRTLSEIFDSDFDLISKLFVK